MTMTSTAGSLYPFLHQGRDAATTLYNAAFAAPSDQKVQAHINSSQWQPQKMEMYLPGNEYGDWMLEETTQYSYSYGLLMSESLLQNDKDTQIVLNYSYDDAGRLIEIKRSETGKSSTKTEFEYDEIVKDHIISKMTYRLNGDGSSKLIEGMKEIITRNADGNVVMFEELELSGDDICSTQIFWVDYDDNGIAYSIHLQIPESWIDIIIKDIEWNRTDGQFFSFFDGTDWTNEVCFSGRNRISYAKMETLFLDGSDGIAAGNSYDYIYNADYDEFGFGYNLEVTLPSGVSVLSLSLEQLDDNGSYEMWFQDSDDFEIDCSDLIDFYDFADPDFDFEKSEKILYCIYDKYGLKISNGLEAKNKELDVFCDIINIYSHVHYNSEYGYPEEVVTIYELPPLEWQYYVSRVVYSDFVNMTGIDKVSSDSEVQWYTVDGMKVEGTQLASGLYIRKSSKGASKIFVR